MTTNTNNTIAATAVQDILNKRDKDIKEILNKAVNAVDDILNQTNKDIADILNQTTTSNTPVTTNKKWWEKLDIDVKTQYQSGNTIIGWKLVADNSTSYFPLFERTDGDSKLTDIFSELPDSIREELGLGLGISLSDEIIIGEDKIVVEAICLNDYRDKYEFNKKIYAGGVENFQRFVAGKDLKRVLCLLIKQKYIVYKFFN